VFTDVQNIGVNLK